jgi:membrane protein implicated in regulation of membrane protease activity
MIWEIWWVWIAAALALGILEVLAPGFIFLGFALGAGAVGLLMALGFVTTLPWLLVIFAAVSLLAWVVMRKYFGIRRGQVKHITTDINED